MALTPTQRMLANQAAAYERWARTPRPNGKRPPAAARPGC
jgi:hypothetical protein